MAKLQEMGEFVRSASSTIEAPVVRRLKEAFSAEAPKQGQAKKAAAPAGADRQNGARKAPARRADAAAAAAGASGPAAATQAPPPETAPSPPPLPFSDCAAVRP